MCIGGRVVSPVLPKPSREAVGSAFARECASVSASECASMSASECTSERARECESVLARECASVSATASAVKFVPQAASPFSVVLHN